MSEAPDEQPDLFEALDQPPPKPTFTAYVKAGGGFPSVPDEPCGWCGKPSRGQSGGVGRLDDGRTYAHYACQPCMYSDLKHFTRWNVPPESEWVIKEIA